MAANTISQHCNWQKTMLQTIGPKSNPPPLQFRLTDSHTANPVTKITYLVSDIDADGYTYARDKQAPGLASP